MNGTRRNLSGVDQTEQSLTGSPRRNLVLISLNHDPLGLMGETHAGGQAKYVLEVARYLSLFNWNIVIYTLGGAGRDRTIEVSETCELVRVERRSRKPYDYDVSINEVEEIAQAILLDTSYRGSDVDLIYACFWLSGLTAIPISEYLKCPFVFTFCQLGVFKAQWDGLAAVRHRIEHERRVCIKAATIIATNRDEMTAIVGDYGVPSGKVCLIPRGIDLEVFHP